MRSVTITRAARSAHVASLGLVCVLAGACMREPIQLGEGRQTDSGITGDASPLAQDGGAITPALPVTDLALGGETSCALLADGRVACWGADDFGELAIDPDVSLMRPSACGERRCLRTPAVSPYLSGVVELGLGAHFGCARTSRGAVSCWGDNRFGQLGRGTGGATSGIRARSRSPPMPSSSRSGAITRVCATQPASCAVGGSRSTDGSDGRRPSAARSRPTSTPRR